MDLGGVGGIAGHVGDALDVPGDRGVGDAPAAARHLLHGPAGERHSEQMRGPGDARGELQHAPFGRDARRAGDVVPRRREVDRRAAAGGKAIQVGGRAERLAGGDDLIEALFTDGDDRSVGGPDRRAVVEAVVGDAPHLALELHREDVGALVDVLVALEHVRGEDERPAVGSPRRRLHVHALGGELARRATLARDDEQLLRRRRVRIARIGQVAAAVEARVHPVVDSPGEAIVGGLLERRARRCRSRRGGWHRLGERDPLVVGAEDRRAVDAGNAEGLAARPVHAQEPDGLGHRSTGLDDGAARREGEQPAVGAPARARRRQRGVGQAPWRRRAVGRDGPDLAVAAVLGLDDERPHERHGAAVGRQGRAVDGLDAVVVGQLDRAVCRLGGG